MPPLTLDTETLIWDAPCVFTDAEYEAIHQATLKAVEDPNPENVTAIGDAYLAAIMKQLEY